MPRPPPHPDDPAAHEADLALASAVQQGEPAAWSTLLSRHQDRLYAVCLRMVGRPDTAADLCQDTLVKIIQGLGSYDGQARLSTWMIRIAMNVCLSHLRSQKLRRHESLDTPTPGGADSRTGSTRGSSLTSGEPDPAASVEYREAVGRMAAALASLEPEQRAILVLRDVRGLDYDQIAAVLGVAVGTVKSRLFRSRAALRELIEHPESKQAPSQERD